MPVGRPRAEQRAMRLVDLPTRLTDGPAGSIISYEGGEIIRRSYAHLAEDVRATAEKLRGSGVVSGMRVGIRASNSYRWLVNDLALIELRAVSVAFTDDFDDHDPAVLAERYRLGLLLEGEEEHATALDAYLEDDPDFDTPGMIFSTGSAGGVKGMVLNRRGIEANVDAFTDVVAPTVADRVLLFLPISNFQQRLIYYTALWSGAELIVTDPQRLFRALKELQPTILVAPPMLYEGLAARCEEQTGSGASARYEDVRVTLGGKVRFAVTGMAPTSLSTLELFARMELPLYETYGLIEAGTIAFNRPGAQRLGSVGRPIPGVEIEIGEDAEIVVRKEHPVTQGYFECAEGEAERIYLADGRIATGDCGRFDDDGFLYLEGRRGEVIVTPGGEKAHPEVLEAEIDSCADAEKSVVFGDGGRGLVAVIVLRDPEDAGARERLEEHVERMNVRWPAMSIERLAFTETPFSRENGQLRPNLKLDRRAISQAYAAGLGARER